MIKLLPEDILIEIINKVDISELLGLLGVNKYFYSLTYYTLSIKLDSAKPLDSLRVQNRWNSQRFTLNSTKFDKYFIKWVFLVDNLVITCSSDSLININNDAYIKCNDDLVSLMVRKVDDFMMIVTSYFNNQPASCVYKVSIDKPHKIELLSAVYSTNWSTAHSISIGNNFVAYSSFNNNVHLLNYKTNQHFSLFRHSNSKQPLAQLKLFNRHLIVITKYSQIEFYELPDILSSNQQYDKSLSSINSTNSFRESDHCLESRKSSFVNSSMNQIIPTHTINQSTLNNLIHICKFSNSIERNDYTEECHLISLSRNYLHKTTFNSNEIHNPKTQHYPLQSPSPLMQHFNTDYTVMTIGQFIDVSDTKYFFSIITGGYYPKCTVIDNNFNIVFPTADAQHMGVIIDADFDDNNGKVVFCTSQGYVHVLDYLT